MPTDYDSIIYGSLNWLIEPINNILYDVDFETLIYPAIFIAAGFLFIRLFKRAGRRI